MFAELTELNPDAKVILTIRNDFEEWYASAAKTILSASSTKNARKPLWDRMNFKRYASFLPSRKVPETKEEFREMYHAWIKHVETTVPAEKLLIFRPNDGWEPLCKHLQLPIPLVPYPAANDRKAFMKDKSQWADFSSITIQPIEGIINTMAAAA